jgi:Ca2+-binding EF-hand superfamily protein
MTDKPPRRTKKSETLQIRIPHELKKKFLGACREDDVAASDLIRGWIDTFLVTRERPLPETPKGLIAMIPTPIRKRRYLVAVAVAMSATALLALPSAAQPFRAMFDQLDANRDGGVTEKEFMAMAKEFKQLPEVKLIKPSANPCDRSYSLDVGPVSNAKFANPWMNSNPDDMWRAYVESDRNRDGVVMFAEFQVRQTEMAQDRFRGMDRNFDQALSSADREQMRIEWEAFRKANPDLVTCPTEENPPPWIPLDTDKNGAVTFEEYLAAAEKLDPR